MTKFLSIDIGIKNLGWTYIVVDEIEQRKKAITKCDECDVSFFQNISELRFGIYSIDENKTYKDSVVKWRCKKINDFFAMFDSLDYIIIERQVNTNTMAMELMYAIVMKAMSVVGESNVFIFDPKVKFTFYGEEYTTKNKAHKKYSIAKATNILTQEYPELLDEFNKYNKKDDISDSLNQLLTFLEMRFVPVFSHVN